MNFITRAICCFAALLALATWPTQAQTLNLPVVEITAGENAPHLAQYVRFAKQYDGDINYQSLTKNIALFDHIEGGSIQFGRASPDIVILTRVKNVGQTVGHWVFSTDRGSATTLQIYYLSPEQKALKFDSDDYAAAKETLLAYQHYAAPLTLEPQQEVLIVVKSSVEDSAYFPLVIQDRERFYQSSNLTMLLAAGCTAAILALLILNLFFYLSTGRNEFVWLVAAEFFLATVVMYLVGFLSTYVFYAKPMWGLIFGDVTKYGYVACMSQFARVFIDTRKNLPKTDTFLKALICFSLIMIFVQLFSHFIPLQTRITLHGLNYLIVAASSFYFTYIGIYATQKVGRENWPLILAWGSLAVFAMYAACAFSGVIPNLPMSFYAIAPVAVIEAAFATLALGLNVRKSQFEHDTTKQRYLESLQEQLVISEAAQQLAEEKSAALSTVVDQSALLHASGHDSQQVLLALNSVLDAVKNNNQAPPNADIVSVLESTASYLDKIVATTLSGARIGNSNTRVLALSAVSVKDIIEPLEMMYRQQFVRKGLRFSIKVEDNIKLVTDRALLTRALSNFLSNSHKFTTQGGVTVAVYGDQQNLVIQIEDTGCGVSKDAIEQLNANDNNRVRDDVSESGSGSGYRYAQKVIQGLGGTLKITSGGKQTLVVARIPRVEHLTPCTLDQLQCQTIGAHITDWDKQQTVSVPTSQKRSNTDTPLQAVATYDDSASTRQSLNTVYDIIIYKPLYAEYAQYLKPA